MVLMKWGVFEITELNIEKLIFKAKYLPEDKDFKSPPKFTWLIKKKELNITVTVNDYDHLLSVPKPEPNKEFSDYINNNNFH